ncbi:MAG: succinate dehydrogenase, hydrophobic membrane anchor protein [Candidatus Competibacteraceae bacterium]
MSLRTPIGRARGLGSAKEGVAHWWAQRVTAVALVPLTLWFVISLLFMARADYESLQAWIAQPLVTVLLVAFLFSLFYHTILGMQVVIEDYVHQEGAKFVSLMVMKFLLILLGGSAVIAVLRIAFGG